MENSFNFGCMKQVINSIHHVDYWLSVETYGRESKIGNRAVYQRIKRKAISFIRIDDWVVIDARLSRPAKQLSPRQIAPPFVLLAGMPPYSELIRITSFCEREGIRGHTLFTAIILGDLPAWAFADQVFIKDGPELDQYVTHRRKRR